MVSQVFNSSNLISLFPGISTSIFICADMSQIIQIVRMQNSNQHSLIGWGAVLIALVLWIIFFYTKTRNERVALWSAVANFTVVAILFITVIIYR